jgi:hypothetical protein
MLCGGDIRVWLSNVADPKPKTRPEKKLAVVERRLTNLPRPARLTILTMPLPYASRCARTAEIRHGGGIFANSALRLGDRPATSPALPDN